MRAYASEWVRRLITAVGFIANNFTHHKSSQVIGCGQRKVTVKESEWAIVCVCLCQCERCHCSLLKSTSRRQLNDYLTPVQKLHETAWPWRYFYEILWIIFESWWQVTVRIIIFGKPAQNTSLIPTLYKYVYVVILHVFCTRESTQLTHVKFMQVNAC